MYLFATTILSLLFGFVVAQFPPKPSGTTTIQSKRKPGASLSFKQTQICETTDGVRSFSGYVNLPASIINDTYNASLFWWYFEARNDSENAPLAIYIAGGPGQSSLLAATGQGGPCYINEDSNSTTLNPWSWNDKVNVMYIDSPAQTGYSYDSLVNGTLNQLNLNALGNNYTPQEFSSDPPFEANSTLLYGTFPSQQPSGTANNSLHVARALYQFTQVWINEFPQYNTTNHKVSLWTNSWGGFYGPTIWSYFNQQNKRIKKQSYEEGPEHPDILLELDVLGLLEGCVDQLLESPFYPQIAYKNTYNFSVINKTTYLTALTESVGPVGIQDQIKKCRTLAAQDDPEFISDNAVVNEICSNALLGSSGQTEVLGSDFDDSDRSAYDISHHVPDPYPYGYASGFFNQAWVQAALGVPLNFTLNAYAPEVAIGYETGDGARNSIAHLNYLLSNNLKVAMIHGDRDYRCNWLGGQHVSLSAQFPGAGRFRSSGYANISTNDTYGGGVVRQSGIFSFSRIFQAGHYPHFSQPETVYRLFNRLLSDLDLATGLISTAGSAHYHTTGSASSFEIQDVMPVSPPIHCNTWQTSQSCTANQIAALRDGTAVVENSFVVSPTS